MGETVYIRVTLQRGAQIGYEGEIQVGQDQSTDQTSYRLRPEEVGLNALDLSEREAYGDALWKLLFGPSAAQAALLRGAEQAWNRGIPVRLQLHLQESAHELTHLAWELLRTPRGGWLACSQGILFSRYLPLNSRHGHPRVESVFTSQYRSTIGGPLGPSQVPGSVIPEPLIQGTPVYPPARPSSIAEKGHSPLALAVVSCPPGNRFGLPALDAQQEIEAARAAIPGAQVDALVTCPGEPVTLERLVARLRQGAAGRPYDILYLACYTRPNPGFPGLALLFEPESGRDALIQEAALAQHLSGLPPRARPRLLALAACDLPEAETPNEHTTTREHAALGERALFGHALTQAGIPAVLAMPHAAVGTSAALCESARKLLPVFFTELFKDGFPDRALAIARRDAGGEDWWHPVLYVHGPSLPL